MIVWTAWFGSPMPPYIKYCIETIEKRCGYPLVVLTEDNMDKYLHGCGLNERVFELERPAQVADCIRIAILYRYGGMWVDADTICLKPFDKVFELMRDGYFGFVTDPKTHVPYNGYLVSKAVGAAVGRWRYLINNALKKMHSLPEVCTKFHMFGSDMMGEVAKIEHVDIPFQWFFPFNFSDGNGKIFNQERDIKDYITQDTIAIALSNSWITYEKTYVDKSVEDAMNDKTLFGSILRYSKEIG